MLLRSRMPAISKVAVANQRNLAQVRCAIAALAAERYRRAHGNWPASLQALVADGLLKQVPGDPYDGAPLRFCLHDDRVVISSIGMDREDNGGTFDNKSRMTKGTHIGFTLWNAAQRRLLPLPAAEPPAPGQPGAGPGPGPASSPGAKEPDQ
jgi:hypothetical protein